MNTTTNHADEPASQDAEIHHPYAWNHPVPLTPTVAPEIAYPVDALPSALRQAVSTYQTYGQQPIPLIACSALANLSLACQSLGPYIKTSALRSH